MGASDRERWDERHRAALADGGRERPPAAWLAAHHDLLARQPHGRALDIACGLGRNALYLAGLGFTVDAVDVSSVAVEHLSKVAGERGAAVRAHRLDLAVDPLPTGPYEVIVNTYFLDRRLHRALVAALAPGGLLVFETFLPDPAATYGPQDSARVLQPGELRRAFPGLAVLDYREGTAEPASRAVASLVARRPVG